MAKKILEQRPGTRREVQNLNELVAKKAYELYEKSGWIEGRDIQNWLEAERIVKGRALRS